MTDKRPAPSRDELHAALDWIKDHKKRSVSHTIILILLAIPCAGMFGAAAGALFALSSEVVGYISLAYIIGIVTALFVF